MTHSDQPPKYPSHEHVLQLMWQIEREIHQDGWDQHPALIRLIVDGPMLEAEPLSIEMGDLDSDAYLAWVAQGARPVD